MKYIELFSGIGGMGHGLMQAGMECAGYCEIDKFAHQAFKILHDPEERMWEAYDVRAVTDDDIRFLGRERGPIDLIAGGFPCQAFSIAGKRKGFQDSTRGTLFFEIIRFASILKPKYLLLENVTGLLNHDGGRTFETVIRTLDELGYVGEWCVLNSSAYVPQNRERVFIVASLGGSSGKKVFPFSAENEKPVKCDSGIERNKILVNVSQKTGVNEVENAACLDANYFKGLGAEPRAVISPDYATKTMNGRRIKEPGEAMFALTVQDRHGITDGYRIRKLTPLECFRLQSFPDEWYHTLKEHGISDSQLYKMAGNAVTSRVAYEIGKRLIAQYCGYHRGVIKFECMGTIPLFSHR